MELDPNAVSAGTTGSAENDDTKLTVTTPIRNIWCIYI